MEVMSLTSSSTSLAPTVVLSLCTLSTKHWLRSCQALFSSNMILASTFPYPGVSAGVGSDEALLVYLPNPIRLFNFSWFDTTLWKWTTPTLIIFNLPPFTNTTLYNQSLNMKSNFSYAIAQKPLPSSKSLICPKSPFSLDKFGNSFHLINFQNHDFKLVSSLVRYVFFFFWKWHHLSTHHHYPL